MHFAVAGCGVISRFHLDAIRSIEDAALCGVYDPVEASARAAAQAYGTRAYPDYDALLADPQVDAVCICTPSHLHAPLALQAVAAGKHVLIEKPVALTLEDCDAVAAAARAAGVQVGVVSQLRYGPAVAPRKTALEIGGQGRITRYLAGHTGDGWRRGADEPGDPRCGPCAVSDGAGRQHLCAERHAGAGY